MSLLFVVGTRPEAIKLAPVVLAARARGHRAVLCTTGQHPALVAPALEVFGLRAEVALSLAQPQLASFAGRALEALGGAIAQEQPRAVLVQGDTSSALAGGLAAAYAQVPLVHVEAGLRSYDRAAPFPEETHRVLLSQLAALHCAPTAQAAANLAREGVGGQVVVVGNPVIDALRLSLPLLQAQEAQLAARFPFAAGRLLLATVHRRESFGAPLVGICEALRAVVAQHEGVALALPVHPHPAVQGTVRKVLGGVPRVHLLEPLPYLELQWLLRRAHLVLTDSGGLQEEAPAFGKPVLVLREVTERPEGVAAGSARLVGTGGAAIVEAASALLADSAAYAAMAQVRYPYGEGHAAEAIVEQVEGLLRAR
jgi:UDP-N-acetylglucosamine 2-epimerase (non-hydrolysing)